jgi:AraC-like DNA-binding protein
MPSLSERSGFAEHRFSTSAVAAEGRLAFWRDSFASQVVRVDVQPRSSKPFAAQALLQSVPGLRVATFAATAAHMHRTERMIVDGDDAFTFLTPLHGKLQVRQRNREVTLGAGEAVLLLHDELATVTHDDIRYQALIVPRAPVAAALKSVDDAVIRPICRNNAILRLLMSYLEAIPNALAAAPNHARTVVASHVHDLIALAANPDGGPVQHRSMDGLHAAKLDALKADLMASVGCEDLTIAELSARHRITPRTVQRLFEHAGSTFSAFKLEQQLLHARRLLAGGRERAGTIADVAYASGFSDLSYFYRAFRRRFGMTPSDVRTQVGPSSEPIG